MPKSPRKGQIDLDSEHDTAREVTYAPALLKKPTKISAPEKENYGSWMLVKRKKKKAPIRTDPKGTLHGHQVVTKPQDTGKHTVYNNILYKSRFAPIGDLDDDQFTSPMPQAILHGESSKRPPLG